MDKGQELLQEEQLDTLKTLVTEINGLKEALTNELAVKQTNNPDKLEVSGVVQVNTEKEVAITNIGDFTSGLDALGDKLSTIIKESSHKPLDSVTIKNIEQAIAKEIKVSNLSELTHELRAVKQAILDTDKQPIVNVEKQEVVFPTDPKKPMAVRLSDGKSFYTAMTAAVSSGINTQNLATTAKQDEIIAALGGGSLVPEVHDEIVLTYVPSGNGVGEIATAVYKLDSATVATLTLSYNGDNKLSGVVRT